MTSGNVFSVCKSIEWIKFMDWTLLCKCTPLTTILWIHFKLNTIYLGILWLFIIWSLHASAGNMPQKIEVFWPHSHHLVLFFLKIQNFNRFFFCSSCLSNAMWHLYVIFSSKLINLTFFMKWKLCTALRRDCDEIVCARAS